VGKAHLEGFGSLKGVLNAKSELYSYLAAHGGEAIIDGSDEVLLGRALELGVRRLVVAAGGELSVQVKLVSQKPWLEVELVLGDEVQPVSTRLVGAYNLQNILLAAATGVHFGIPGKAIAEAISLYIPENQRSQMLEGKRNYLVLDSYNANPSSMREAIGGFLSYAKSPTMLILGDMAELGDASEEKHRELVQWMETLEVDRILLAGPQFHSVCEPSGRIGVFRGRAELESFLRRENPTGYHILLKGSRVMEFELLTPLLS